MKKALYLTVAVACLITTAVVAQQRAGTPMRNGKCSYSPLQDLVRSARDANQINQLSHKNVNFNVPQRCGGSLLQLAIQRGNPEVVKALLEAGADVTQPVSLDGFTIAGAPKEIPLLAFAAFYSVRSDIVEMLIKAGGKVTELDSNGQTILWYLDQNPVLRKTALEDEITATLLVSQPQMPETAATGDVSTLNTQAHPSKPVARKVVDPRQPAETPSAPLITKTSRDSVGYKTPMKKNPAAAQKLNAALPVEEVKEINEIKVEEKTPELPDGIVVIRREAVYPTREIVEPDMPVK